MTMEITTAETEDTSPVSMTTNQDTQLITTLQVGTSGQTRPVQRISIF
jgi:hypothetical protein